MLDEVVAGVNDDWRRQRAESPRLVGEVRHDGRTTFQGAGACGCAVLIQAGVLQVDTEQLRQARMSSRESKSAMMGDWNPT